MIIKIVSVMATLSKLRKHTTRCAVDCHRQAINGDLKITATTWVEVLRIAIRLFSLSVLFSAPAYAYVDPGSSLLLLQGLFAAAGAALTYFRKPWQLLIKLFSRKKNSDA